jgi:hypothetical protein
VLLERVSYSKLAPEAPAGPVGPVGPPVSNALIVRSFS